ncbi:MAG TPA: DUF3426 domain-containing protein [Lysobacter sp.]
MFVACPHCGFLVALVAMPEGEAQRCPRCDGLLDAEPAERDEPVVVETAADAPADADADADATVAESTDAASASLDPATTDAAAPTAPASAPGPAAVKPARQPRAPRPRHAPSFVRTHAPASTKHTDWRWWLALAGLALLLALQLLLAQRDELAASARWRPVITQVCGVLRCELPPWREPAAFTMLHRSVQPRPGTPGVLNVTASFRNDARWPQPWPTVLLSLSDVDGRQVGLRAFAPQEYRKGGDADRIAPGQSASVQLDVIEPAPRIVAFTFDFK